MVSEPIKKCRVCGNDSLAPCVKIGSQFLSSVFPENLDYRDKVPSLPLDLVLCAQSGGKKSCGLLQLAHRIDLSAMYEAYPYTSATNSAMNAVLKDVADSGRAAAGLRAGDTVLDIGSNDGTLLGFFKDADCDLIGIDPAKNVKPILSSPRFRHVRGFFSSKTYASATDKKAKLIFSIAMFYHLPDPTGFSAEAAQVLTDDGVWVIQMAYLPTMLATNMYDNIVHEHAGYYSVHVMDWIMEKAGLEIFDVELNDVYGGSFRVFVKKKGSAEHPASDRYHKVVEQEKGRRLREPATYQAFLKRIESTRADLRSLCERILKEGKTIWVYGASTKGNTILQYCGLDKDTITAAAEANPFKLGKFIIGADIPIRDEAAMRAAKPDYLLLLPYSFAAAFIKREAALVEKGTKFIIPLPEVAILP